MMKIAKRLAERNRDPLGSAPVLIACLGDSVTHGCFEVFVNRFGNIDTRCDQEQGYVARLRRRLGECYPMAAASVLNAGISGDSAPNGLERLERDVLRRAPDLVTVNFGLNDAMRGMEGLEAYRFAMDGIFARLEAAGVEGMLVTPNRMCAYVAHDVPEGLLRDVAEQSTRVQNDGVLDAYVQAAREVAERHGAPVADAYRVWNDMERAGVDTTAMLINGINHPTPKAHRIFVEQILARIFEEGTA